MAHCLGTFTIKSTAFHVLIPNHRTKQSTGIRLRNLKLPISRRRENPGIVSAVKQQTHVQVDVNPPRSVSPIERSSGGNMWITSGVILAAALTIYFFMKGKLFGSNDGSIEEDDEKIYASALARTRQSIYVHRAIGFMNTNSPARVVVELERALKENSVCRSELVHVHHSQDELQGLYRMHILNAELPPDYATLLQLREMLGISTKSADKIEKDIFHTDAFTI